MPDFTFWEMVLLGLMLTCVQTGTHFLFQMVISWNTRRKDNRICELYLNDKYMGLHSFKECRDIYEDTQCEHRKSSGFSKKDNKFEIKVDHNQ